MKKVKMSNIDFIRKWQTSEEYDWTVLVTEDFFIDEIDEENEVIYGWGGEEVSFEEIENYSIHVNECSESEVESDVKLFLKSVKDSIKFCSKNYRGHGYVFSCNNDDNFLNEEYLSNEWNDIFNIFEDFERGLKIIEMSTIEECINK